MAKVSFPLVFDARNIQDGISQVIAALQALRDLSPEVASDDIVVTAPPTPASVVGARPPIAWGSKVSATFRDRVWWVSDDITSKQGAFFDPNWLMACMAWESGESFSPAKKNMAGSGATGLIQFMPTTAKELGEYRKTTLTTDALAKMTAEDQLTWVYWYFRMQIARHGPITNLEDCYMAILWPGAIGKPVSAPLWEKGAAPTTYRQNAGLDTNKDGTITKQEAAGHVREKLDKGIKLAA
jgi:hypothetical protein